MTYKQFLDDLSRLKGKYTVRKTGLIRAKRISTGYCPIAGVNKMRTGYGNACGNTILSKTLTTKIIYAADNVNVKNRTIRKVRHDMLRTLGLK